MRPSDEEHKRQKARTDHPPALRPQTLSSLIQEVSTKLKNKKNKKQATGESLA